VGRWVQVRRKMVQGVRETIAVLCDFKAGADAAALQEKLIETFVNLLESVLIELEYSVAISSSSLVVRRPHPACCNCASLL